VSSVQVAVSGLRTALGDRGDVPLLRTVPVGYQLALDPDALDVARFRRHTHHGAVAENIGDFAGAAASYRSALSEWTGDALHDLQNYRFAAEFAVSLEHERLECLDRRIGVDLTLGRHREVGVETTALIARFPLHEGLWAHHLLALYRTGRQAEALSAYSRIRANLDDELGIEPGAQLRELHVQILNQDPGLHWVPLTQARPGSATERDLSARPSASILASDGRRSPVGELIRLGRDAANDLVGDDPRASRLHAVVTRSPAGFVVTDLNSTNGTRVNGGLIVVPTTLADGDVISIGTTELTFHLDAG
jgi:DNA-binding SARP family transcriptional activator